MKIARPPEDFLPDAICNSLQSKMSESAWFDFEEGSNHERRFVLENPDPFGQIVQFLEQFKYALDADEVLFAGFDPNGRLVWFPFQDNKAHDDAVMLSIAKGVPIESAGEKNLTVLPVYDFSHRHDKNDYVCGAVCVLRRQEKSPPTELQWLRTLRILSRWSWPLFLAIDKSPGKLAMLPLPKNARLEASSWKENLHFLTRDNLNDMVNASAIQGLDQAIMWLQHAVSQIGFADSRQMHPDELLHSIEKSLSKNEAGEISRSASATASNISQTASVSEWSDTADSILNAMGAVFVQTPAIYFATVNHGQDDDVKLPDEFHVIHSQATPTPESAEIKALQALAFWVGLTGEPLYLSPNEGCNKILQLVRGATTHKMPIIAIPIFGWPEKTSVEMEAARYTGLHGVFVGFRREAATQPSLAAWLTWVYTAQHMLAPMAVASQHGKLKYRPINIERSLAKAAATHDRLMLPWKYCGAWRKTRPIE